MPEKCPRRIRFSRQSSLGLPSCGGSINGCEINRPSEARRQGVCAGVNILPRSNRFSISRTFPYPPGFPSDQKLHGFDNVGEGLVVSPLLLESYAQTASLVADEIFPPPRAIPESRVVQIDVDDLALSYSSGTVIKVAVHLGMNFSAIERSCTWPSRFETRDSGVYRLSIELSAFRPRTGEAPMIAKILARDVSSKDSVSHKSLRLLKEIEVTSESPEVVEFDAELYEGQTPVVLWANATLNTDRGGNNHNESIAKFFRQRERETPGYLEAWHSMLENTQGPGFRGGLGWELVKAQLERGDLPALSQEEREALLEKVASNPNLYGETVVFDAFENGPALAVHGVTVEGPLRITSGPRDREQSRLNKRFEGVGQSPSETIERFLAKAFRRPVDEETRRSFLTIYEKSIASGQTHDQAMHLVIRSALISPRFLYRCLHPGPLDHYDLATRLAYFLTGYPPDEELMAMVEAGNLSDRDVLRAQAERLLPTAADAPLVKGFTSQWLDTEHLPDIMPDPKFNFGPGDITAARLEVEHFFAEMLRENRPMTDFVDPDFTWTSPRIARSVYGLERGIPKRGNRILRVELPRGGRYGGVLGQSAVMMATANGVDTQPVLRGVWVLENILGTPPPPHPRRSRR